MVLSILITHYNRSQVLKDCINSFKNLNMDISYEFVICDDCSEPSHLDELKKISQVKLIQSETNLGLGAAINRGLGNCSGKFILYCQEDFLIQSSFSTVLSEIIELLEKDKIDMVRLTANYKFPELLFISKSVSQIPKLSFKNFLYNAFQYSDNPFVIKNGFHERNGFYLENVKGSYCELEYAIRIMKSKVKVGILNQYVFNSSSCESVLNYRPKEKKIKFKKIYKFIRALRLHFEYMFYDFKERKLLTYKKTAHYLTPKKD